MDVNYTCADTQTGSEGNQQEVPPPPLVVVVSDCEAREDIVTCGLISDISPEKKQILLHPSNSDSCTT